MSVLEEIRHFFLSDPAKIGAQPVSAAEIVEAVHAWPGPASAPSPLARIAADLLSTSTSEQDDNDHENPKVPHRAA
jgi:hypothetical protein